ncbi:MAG TPA: formate dehydrogenase [Burkholderiales bacterium]|nr:formate dehydrogenase [Burkholderiales bacterium]
MSERTKKLSRRNFLLTLGAGGAATAAAVVATRAPNTKPAPSSSRDKRATRGYQETAHTSNYYRTTKV